MADLTFRVRSTDSNGLPTGVADIKLVDIGGGVYALATAGSATGTSASQVQGTASDGSAASGKPVQVGGVDASGNAQSISTDTVGSVYTRSALQSTSALTSAAISFSSSGDNTIVSAGVGAVTTRVHRLFIVVAGATSITIKNGAGASLTGAMSLSAGGSIVLDFNQEPWFKTSAATAFIINSSAAVQVSGMVDYVKD
jgi:hypothetical protein